ncbi:MAG: hydrogenase maturation nickel metallochaperone HypA [Syntrophomonas sp.]|nr:hydrogenase maturation nickel metallochaperone HypA [Syntrophomonas sp.]
MHELSIMEGVMNMVRESAQQNGIMKVNKLKLVIGRLTMVLPDSLQFCFQVLSQDDLFRNAVLEVEPREVIMRCMECETQFAREDPYCYICPGCGANQVEIVQGRELFLDYYEGE